MTGAVQSDPLVRERFPPGKASTVESTVQTPYGTVRGASVPTASGPVEAYLGIPFAAPPIGPDRFRAPTPVEPWVGVRDAVAFGPAVPQQPDPFVAVSGAVPPPISEAEGLNLAIWTPAADGGARPVIVWIHGGAYVNGSNSVASSNGAELSAAEGIVVVALNYRLGLLGFLHLEHLLGPEYRDSANVGLLDILAGLRWVRESIRAFGGDPDAVTLMGQSAGGAAVATLLGAQAAEGLFARAIIQSGTAERVRTPAEAEAMTAVVLDEAHLDPSGAAELLRMPVDALLDLQGRVAQRFSAETIGISLPFQPVLGGDLLPIAPIAALAEGVNARADLLIGTTLNEGSFFTAMPNPRESRTARERGDLVLNEVFDGAVSYAEYEDAVARATDRTPEDRDVLEALLSDRTYRQPTMRILEARAAGPGSTYTYLFTWPSPLMGGSFGACHTLDVPFVFRQLASPDVRKLVGEHPPAELSERMSASWAQFARRGDPATGAIPWPRWEPSDRATMILDLEPHVESDPRGSLRELWGSRRQVR